MTSPAAPRIRLTRDRVLRTAIDLADRNGRDALTMRRLGEELGVEAMSLYNHVANKDDLLGGMIDLVFGEIDLPSHSDNWKDALRKRSVSLHAALLRHPWAIGLMDAGTQPGPATLRHHDRVIGTLRNGGFSVEAAAHAFSVLDGYIYGFALQEKAVPLQTEEDTLALGHRMLAQFPVGAYPYLAELMTEHALAPGYRYSDEFPLGLDLILDALEAARAA